MSGNPHPTRINWPALYTAQHAALTTEEVEQIRERGITWQLGSLLATGGVVTFPHAAVLDCGYQVAAAARAALESGAEKILVVGVLHAWTDEMHDARTRLAAGEDVTRHRLRGIQGPDVPNECNEWQLDHSLISWRYFWERECDRRAIPEHARPNVREVYPFLAGEQPQSLAHFDEVARWAEDAIIVTTADPFHHGIGYGDDENRAYHPTEGGLDLARASIERGNALLEAGDYRAYLQHCVTARNDARDTGPLFHALRGPVHPQILDLTSSDMTEYYAAPPPTWVAAALVTWQPNPATYNHAP